MIQPYWRSIYRHCPIPSVHGAEAHARHLRTPPLQVVDGRCLIQHATGRRLSGAPIPEPDSRRQAHAEVGRRKPDLNPGKGDAMLKFVLRRVLAMILTAFCAYLHRLLS